MFLIIAIAVWACALVVWWICSNAFRHSDLDKLKSRLIGTTKTKAAKAPRVGRFAHPHRGKECPAGHQVPAALPTAEQVAGDASSRPA